MNYQARQILFRNIEQARSSRVILLATSERQGELWPGKPLSTIVAADVISHLVELLDPIGPVPKISLILHTNGGQTLAAWQIVNLIRTFADEVEVLIPQRALSAGTLIAMGANRIVMTKQAVLGPIDPSINNPLNPQVASSRIPISVENIWAYMDTLKRELGFTGMRQFATILNGLSTHLHPVVIGEAFRTQEQIRFLARKLLKAQLPYDEAAISRKLGLKSSNEHKTNTLIDFLCADSGSHDYTINRREAASLGLNIEKPSQTLYQLLIDTYKSFAAEMKLSSPYSGETLLGQNKTIQLREVRGLVESTDGGSIAFLNEGTITRTNPDQYNTSIHLEAWTRIH